MSAKKKEKKEKKKQATANLTSCELRVKYVRIAASVRLNGYSMPVGGLLHQFWILGSGSHSFS